MSDPIHAMLVRARLTGLDDSGGIQRVSAVGLAGSRYTDVLRLQPFGFSSTPPDESIGWLLHQSANYERALALGFEHPDHRPGSLARGGTRIYDASGQVISIVEKKIRIVGGDEIHLSATTIILEGMIKLGSASASRPASAQGTIDTGGFADVSNPATKVLME
jgi:phage gp45-like